VSANRRQAAAKRAWVGARVEARRLSLADSCPLWSGAALYSLEECAVATLHIEHGITDFSAWKTNFDRFAAKRSEAGVTAHRIYQPHDNAAYVVIQLDFPSVEQAQAYQEFLKAHVWSTPANSPGLVGPPRVCVLVATAEQ
jgi:hypothetical protein